MYRIVIYRDPYGDRPMEFNSSTIFETLGVLEERLPSNDKIKKLTSEEIVGDFQENEKLTHVCNKDLGVIKYAKLLREGAEPQRYIGVVLIADNSAVEKAKDGASFKEVFDEAYFEGDLYIEEYGKGLNNQEMIILESWRFFTAFELMGFDIENALEEHNIECGFYDDTFKCDECGIIQSNDDYHEINKMYVENEFGDGAVLGKSCGCYSKWQIENIETLLWSNTFLTKEASNELVEKGVLFELKSACSVMFDNSSPSKMMETLGKLAEDREIDLDKDDELETEGLLIRLNSVSQFGVCYTAMIYRKRPGNAESMLSFLSEKLEAKCTMGTDETGKHVVYCDGEEMCQAAASPYLAVKYELDEEDLYDSYLDTLQDESKELDILFHRDLEKTDSFTVLVKVKSEDVFVTCEDKNIEDHVSDALEWVKSDIEYMSDSALVWLVRDAVAEFGM